MRYLEKKNQVETRSSGKTNMAPGCVQLHEISCSHETEPREARQFAWKPTKSDLTISTYLPAHLQGEVDRIDIRKVPSSVI